jgi:antitoxin component YwqK of YwqJK toxin-antitoxin module
MKIKQNAILFALSCCLLEYSCNQDIGFTNKSEAKNKFVNKLKWGKWIEYKDSLYNIVDDSSAPYYTLKTYVLGRSLGIAMHYYKNGKLHGETPYKRGKVEGIVKWYYENGKPYEEISYTRGMKNGMKRDYYENGNIKSGTPYTFGFINGDEKEYYESGCLKFEAQ